MCRATRSESSVWLILVLLLQGAQGCHPCNRSGCEATEHPISRSQISQGIAGVVSLESDDAINGCAECGFSSAELRVWSTPTRVSDAEGAESVVKANAPSFTINADQRYERSLDAGYYLVCQLPWECASISVPQTGVVTINVSRRSGPGSTSRLLVFDPGSMTKRSEGIFVLQKSM
jgi:hypothetical protein